MNAAMGRHGWSPGSDDTLEPFQWAVHGEVRGTSVAANPDLGTFSGAGGIEGLWHEYVPLRVTLFDHLRVTRVPVRVTKSGRFQKTDRNL